MVSGYICSAWKCESLGSSCDRPRVFKFLGPASLRLVNQVLGDPSLLHLGWVHKNRGWFGAMNHPSLVPFPFLAYHTFFFSDTHGSLRSPRVSRTHRCASPRSRANSHKRNIQRVHPPGFQIFRLEQPRTFPSLSSSKYLISRSQ